MVVVNKYNNDTDTKEYISIDEIIDDEDTESINDTDDADDISEEIIDDEDTESTNDTNDTYNKNRQDKKDMQIVIGIIIVIVCGIVGISFASNIYNSNDSYYNNDSNYNTNDNSSNNVSSKSAKEKVIDRLLSIGFEYNPEKSEYYKVINAEDVPEASQISDKKCGMIFIVDFNIKYYGVYFICYENDYEVGNEVYEKRIEYEWDTNSVMVGAFEFNNSYGQHMPIGGTIATLDQNNNFTCEGDNCNTFRNEIYSVKQDFLNILNDVGVSLSQIR